MLLITGASGFIGSCIVSSFLNDGHAIIAVDEFNNAIQAKNIRWKNQVICIEKQNLFNRLIDQQPKIDACFHIGAITDTSFQDESELDKRNLTFSKLLWKYCTKHSIPLIYASSAATYGAEENNFNDDHNTIPHLHPLNPYGRSKQLFDVRALGQNETPPFWVGLKFFNVYGPNEWHKGRMASVIFHTYKTVQENSKMSLFRSHRPTIKDGHQKRDFIYVKDIIKVIAFLLGNKKQSQISGIYNLGTGTARSFLDLATNVFVVLNKIPNITFIDTPEDIRNSYQYFTQADMQKLVATGYTHPFWSLEDGIKDYIQNYLLPGIYL